MLSLGKLLLQLRPDEEGTRQACAEQITRSERQALMARIGPLPADARVMVDRDPRFHVGGVFFSRWSAWAVTVRAALFARYQAVQCTPDPSR